MSHTELFARVVRVLTPFSKNAKAMAAVTVESKIREDLMVNSARLVDVVLELETAFEIAISDDEADNIETVGDVVRTVSAKVASN